jgi:magnesium chelatase family protein
MTPCPCGYLGDASGRCNCTPDQVARYRARISGPLLDRIDLQVFVPRVDRAVITAPVPPPSESTVTVRDRVVAARQRQIARAQKSNGALLPREIDRDVRLDAAARDLMEKAMVRLALSARAYHRVLRVARTIADLADRERVQAGDVAEAIQLRELDRPG